MTKDESSLLVLQLQHLAEGALKYALEHQAELDAIMHQPGFSLRRACLQYRARLMRDRLQITTTQVSIKWSVAEMVTDNYLLHCLCARLAIGPDIRVMGTWQQEMLEQWKDRLRLHPTTLDHATELGGVGMMLRMLDLLIGVRDDMSWTADLAISALLLIACVEPASITIERHKAELRG